MSSTSRTRGLNLTRILDEPVDWRYKSFPAGPAVPIRAVGEQGWNALDGAFMRPVMVLKGSALRHNLQEMAGYCRMNGIELAPHVKTHMSPQLFRMQLNAGASAPSGSSLPTSSSNRDQLTGSPRSSSAILTSSSCAWWTRLPASRSSTPP